MNPIGWLLRSVTFQKQALRVQPDPDPAAASDDGSEQLRCCPFVSFGELVQGACSVAPGREDSQTGDGVCVCVCGLNACGVAHAYQRDCEWVRPRLLVEVCRRVVVASMAR